MEERHVITLHIRVKKLKPWVLMSGPHWWLASVMDKSGQQYYWERYASHQEAMDGIAQLCRDVEWSYLHLNIRWRRERRRKRRPANERCQETLTDRREPAMMHDAPRRADQADLDAEMEAAIHTTTESFGPVLILSTEGVGTGYIEGNTIVEDPPCQPSR